MAIFKKALSKKMKKLGDDINALAREGINQCNQNYAKYKEFNNYNQGVLDALLLHLEKIKSSANEVRIYARNLKDPK